MSSGFREVIEIRPRPDRSLSFVSFFLVPGGLLSVHVSDISVRWKIAAVLALLVAVAAEIRSLLAPESGRRTLRANLMPDGSWRVSSGPSDPVAARLSRAWGASLGPVMALEWDCDDGIGRCAWLIRRDLSERDWRRLRVRLRLA